MAVITKWQEKATASKLFTDNIPIYFGDDKDASLKWDGSYLEILPLSDDTGAFHVGDGTTDMDVKLFLGSTNKYALFDVGNSKLSLANVSLEGPQVDSAQTVFVDVNQTSSNESGNRGDPYKTIQAAVDAVQALGDNSDTKGYTIYVAPGTYTETLSLEGDSLYNLSFLAMGGPHGVVLDPSSGDALESGSSNDTLHYLYMRGFRFKGNIDFDGASDGTNFLSEDARFEDCTFDEDNEEITIDVRNAGHFIWQNGKIHVLSDLVFQNVNHAEICGPQYMDIFDLVGSPGSTTLTADTTSNKPSGMSDNNAGFWIGSGCFCQRKMPDLTNTGDGEQYVYVNAGRWGLNFATLTIPSGSVLYMYGGVFHGDVTISSGATGYFYNGCVTGSVTETGTVTKKSEVV